LNADFIVLGEGLIFIAENVKTCGTDKYYEISERVTEGIDFPTGYWVSSTVLNFNVIEEVDSEEETTSDDSLQCDESILITGSKSTIYETKDSTTPVEHGLKVGDRVHTSRSITVSVNGRDETRYLIDSVESAEDDSVVGKWLLGDYMVTVNGYQIRYHNRACTLSTYATRDAGASGVRQDIKDRIASINQEGKLAGDKIASNGALIDKTAAGSNVITTSEDGTLTHVDDKYDYTEASGEDWIREYDMYNVGNSSLMDIPIGRMIFVHGMPFQYTYLTDRRINATGMYGKDKLPADGGVIRSETSADLYGRVFAKEIAANMPIAVIVPGVPVFLTNISQGLKGYKGNRGARENLMPFFNDLTETELESAIRNAMESANGETYQYYGMQVDTGDFYNYVNAQTQTSAKLMGIADVDYCGQKCGKFDWSKYNRSVEQDFSMFEDIVGVAGGVSFAFDPLSSITDSLSNDTAESQFVGMIGGLRNTASELEFLTGMAGIGNHITTSNYDAATAGLTHTGGLGAGLANVASRLSALVKNTMHGMNVRFPKLWSDSNYSKSYSIDMRFITPYCTAFCKWRYVLVPFLTLFSAVAPQSPTSIINYKRPFLIRAFSKGYFNVEMGIGSITWKRFGDGDMISADGVPTQIDVTLDIEDLYQQLTISKFTGDDMGILPSPNAISVFFNNTGLMDLIGTLSGVNMNRITLGERLSLYASSAIGAFSATGGNFMRHISDRTRSIVERYLVGI